MRQINNPTNDIETNKALSFYKSLNLRQVKLRSIKGRNEQISEIWIKEGNQLRLLYKAE